MMNFDDLRLLDKKKIVFMPSNLRYKFSEVLAEKRPDIEQESIGRMAILPGSKVEKQRIEFYEKHRDLLADSIYEKDYPVERYEAFISRIEPKQIFEKLKYFYLGKEDPEFLEWDKKNTEPCLVKISEDKEDVVVLPIDCSKFEAFGSFGDIEKLSDLIERKSLTEEDFELIFSAIRKSSEGRD